MRNPKQKQTNIGHSVNNEIIKGDNKNIGYSVKKATVLIFKKNCKLLMIMPKKVYVDRVLKITFNLLLLLKFKIVTFKKNIKYIIKKKISKGEP